MYSGTNFCLKLTISVLTITEFLCLVYLNLAKMALIMHYLEMTLFIELPFYHCQIRASHLRKEQMQEIHVLQKFIPHALQQNVIIKLCILLALKYIFLIGPV